MRAWWTYWATVVIGAVVWINAALVGGREGIRLLLGNPVGLTILLAPIVLAGVNLILYRRSHEEVCRLEVERHRSLRVVAGKGYSANTFAATGVALLALAVVVVIVQLTE
jgi:hypothetical protein